MKFDTWLMVMYNLSWYMYLCLPSDQQDKLADEYEASVTAWK